ncbi:MAG: hypothetical protein MUF81_16640 [Verrucomicrobia bacterium]|nr:hypothetical protein [Verrucomicrobiota bacterium]
MYGELVKGGANVSIADLATDLAKKIAATIGQRGETLVAKVVPREERVEKIKKALNGKALPSVSVKLAERHYGAQTIDPAAETELGKVLQECGFKVVDDKSAEKADVEITGEAFSAFGMCKGNLIGRISVSCRVV